MTYFRIISFVVCFSFSFVITNVNAENIQIRENSPTEYAVKKGDTLWDIAGVFLESPWLWPKIWEKNDQIKNPHLIYPHDVIYLTYKNGKPVLSTAKSDASKLGPSIRTGLSAPIRTIPDSALRSFIEDYRVVDADRINKMPYILANVGSSALISDGDEVFIRGILDPDFVHYDVYRAGNVYDEKYGMDTVSAEIFKIAELRVSTTDGDINKALVVKSNDVILKGDIVVRSNAMQLKPIYYLAAAPEDVEGEVISTTNNAYQVAKYDSVVINLGVADTIYPGHVFNVYDESVSVEDPRTKDIIALPGQVIGQMMVVNVFENVSYGIMLKATKIIPIGAIIKTVQ